MRAENSLASGRESGNATRHEGDTLENKRNAFAEKCKLSACHKGRYNVCVCVRNARYVHVQADPSRFPRFTILELDTIGTRARLASNNRPYTERD